jgi:predicted esterase
MKRNAFFLFLAFCLPSVHAQPYNISDDFISVAHDRSRYFISASSGLFVFNEFLGKADKTKPVVIHSHGCAGIGSDELALKDFYTSLGFSFVMLDFIKRGDASPCNHLGASNPNYKDDSLKYISDLKYRIPARVKELEHHIKLMRSNGFQTIFATGHSEGGMVVQRLSEKVNGVVVHSMTCFPTSFDTSFNRYLHLVSVNDPLLTKTSGRQFGCSDKSNFTVVQSEVKSHAALADPLWKDQIKIFINNNLASK